MTTGKRTKKPGTAKDAVAHDEGAPAAKAGATKEAKAPKKPAAPKKDKEAPKVKPAAGKAAAKPAASKAGKAARPLDEEPELEALDDDFVDDREVDDLEDLEDLDAEGAAPKRAAAAGGKAKAAVAPKRGPAPARAADDEEEDDGFGDEEEDEGDDEDRPRAKGAKPAAPAAAAKPAAKKPGEGEGDVQPALVPARRLTPEAKAKLNELLSKGVSLNEALRQTAQWETFVAPVREAPPAMDRMRPGHRPKAEEREPTIDDLDAAPEDEAEESIE